MIEPRYHPRRLFFHRSPGFTLIELLVVIMIIGLFVGLVIPNLPLVLSSTQLKRDARRIAAEARRLNDLAAIKGQTYVMAIDLETGIVEMGTASSMMAEEEPFGRDPFLRQEQGISEAIYYGGPASGPDVIGLIERQRFMAGIEIGAEEEYESGDAQRMREEMLEEEREARGGLRSFSLHPQVNFDGIHLTRSGVFYRGITEIIFTPEGMLESGVVYLINTEGYELSIVLDETTGDPVVLEGRYEL